MAEAQLILSVAQVCSGCYDVFNGRKIAQLMDKRRGDLQQG